MKVHFPTLNSNIFELLRGRVRVVWNFKSDISKSFFLTMSHISWNSVGLSSCGVLNNVCFSQKASRHNGAWKECESSKAITAPCESDVFAQFAFPFGFKGSNIYTSLFITWNVSSVALLCFPQLFLRKPLPCATAGLSPLIKVHHLLKSKPGLLKKTTLRMMMINYLFKIAMYCSCSPFSKKY